MTKDFIKKVACVGIYETRCYQYRHGTTAENGKKIHYIERVALNIAGQEMLHTARVVWSGEQIPE